MERIEVNCPSCSPGTPVSHIILKANKNFVLQCEECGAVHEYKKPVKISVRVIISDGKQSLHSRTLLSGIINTGDELLVDDESTGVARIVEVTSIEVEDKRKDSAPVEDIQTIWARAVDEVTVKVSVNMRETTKSMELRVSGDTDYIVGEKVHANDMAFRIKQIKLRNGGFIRRKGASVKAKDIKRIVADTGLIMPKKISRKSERTVIKKRVSGWSLRLRKAG